jgi:tight adherence protein C
VSNLRDESQSFLASGPKGLSSPSRNELRQAWSAKDERHKKLGERLVQAGLYKRGSTGAFIVTQLTLCALPVAIGVLAASFHYTSMKIGVSAGICLGVLGVVGPGLWLDVMKGRRQTVIRRSLPDALDLLVVCVEAGMSLPAALVRITQELQSAYPMLTMELIIVHREIQLGASSGEALRRFADRFDLKELRSLSAVIRQAEQFGASITNAIRVHADTLRHQRMEQARERAQKAAVKILFPTILCIFPAVFVVILGPAAYDILEMFERINIPTALGK